MVLINLFAGSNGDRHREDLCTRAGGEGKEGEDEVNGRSTMETHKPHVKQTANGNLLYASGKYASGNSNWGSVTT